MCCYDNNNVVVFILCGNYLIHHPGFLSDGSSYEGSVVSCV